MTNNIIKIFSKDEKYYHLINLDDNWQFVKDKNNILKLYGIYDYDDKHGTTAFYLPKIFSNCKTMSDIKLIADICSPASDEDIEIYNFNCKYYNWKFYTPIIKA